MWQTTKKLKNPTTEVFKKNKKHLETPQSRSGCGTAMGKALSKSPVRPLGKGQHSLRTWLAAALPQVLYHELLEFAF